MAGRKPNKTKKRVLTADEEKLLEQAKQAQKDMELDLEELRKILESDIEEKIEKKRDEKEKELEKEIEARRVSFEDELKAEHRELVAEIDVLRTQQEEISREVSDLEIKKNELESAGQKITENAEKSAEQIIADAEKKAGEISDAANSEAEKTVTEARTRAEKAAQDTLEAVKQREQKTAEKEEALDDKESDLEAREIVLRSKEQRIKKQAEVYETANPDAVATLERQLKQRAEQLAMVQEEYEKAQTDLNRIRIEQIHREGISPEELQRENEQLIARVEELQNKCNRYTDYELSEMQRAFEQESTYLTQIKNLSSELSSRKAELERLNNSILEYEQLRAQMDLLRTLNEHLRSELDNTKRMLESNVGEICPALTNIDIEEAADSGQSFLNYQERQANKNTDQLNTLSDVVRHVKEYAASRDKPLFYSDKDLRAFLAGMAASPMSILQGMSGTGKTSLPKIFCEALLGEISVVPVESSWRDRNELLGYYNDFSKKFTAKEFTCDLYRAGCKRYRDTICFIVLDEMNLSRVEYYFADFLSVLEDKADNWKIRLVDTDMRQLPTEITEDIVKELEKSKAAKSKELLNIVSRLYPDGKLSEDTSTSLSASDKMKLIAYLSDRQKKIDTPANCRVGGPQNLIGGNTIQIPENIWFIGTANRDESTFEITDKVYDRAQVLNFNSRASGTRKEEDVPRIYLTYSELTAMFRKAKCNKEIEFRAEDNPMLQEIENILKNYFRISYGNRIQDQMNIFVPVYVDAGMTVSSKPENIKALINEAIDYQLTNKVLRKLEYEDMNRDAAEKLRKIFERNKLTLATEFLNWKTRGDE